MTAAVWAIAAMADCATAMRPDWDRDQVTGALIAARTNPDWSPGRAVLTLARAIADPDGSPRDLLYAARGPLERSQPASPQAREAIAAAARAAITTHHDSTTDRRTA